MVIFLTTDFSKRTRREEDDAWRSSRVKLGFCSLSGISIKKRRTGRNKGAQRYEQGKRTSYT